MNFSIVPLACHVDALIQLHLHHVGTSGLESFPHLLPIPLLDSSPSSSCREAFGLLEGSQSILSCHGGKSSSLEYLQEVQLASVDISASTSDQIPKTTYCLFVLGLDEHVPDVVRSGHEVTQGFRREVPVGTVRSLLPVQIHAEDAHVLVVELEEGEELALDGPSVENMPVEKFSSWSWSWSAM